MEQQMFENLKKLIWSRDISDYKIGIEILKKKKKQLTLEQMNHLLMMEICVMRTGVVVTESWIYDRPSPTTLCFRKELSEFAKELGMVDKFTLVFKNFKELGHGKFQ